MTLAGGMDQATLAAQMAQQAAQQQYLRDRMSLLEIPMMQQERELALLKLDMDYGALTGYYTMGADGRPKAVAAGTQGAMPSFTREQFNRQGEQWEKQFGAQNWQFIANMLSSKSGPRDYGVYSQLQPNAAFGAMTGTPSWEQGFVNLFNNPAGQAPGTQGVPGVPTTPGTTTPDATQPSTSAAWQLPQGYDFLRIQNALDTWGNEVYSKTGQWPTQQEWASQINATFPDAPESYGQALLNVMNTNNQTRGTMLPQGVNLQLGIDPNLPKPINWLGQAYSAWAPTQVQAPTAPAQTTAAPAPAAGTSAYPWPNDPTAWMTGTAKQIPFRQPIDVSRAEWNQWSPTKQQMELGNVSYNGIDPQDWFKMLQASFPTGTATPTTSWAT